MISTDGFPHMETYISDGSKYLKRLSIVVSGDSGSMSQIILEMIVWQEKKKSIVRLADKKNSLDSVFEAVFHSKLFLYLDAQSGLPSYPEMEVTLTNSLVRMCA
jgi:hypothetical protein